MSSNLFTPSLRYTNKGTCNSAWTFIDGQNVSDIEVPKFIKNLFTSFDDSRYGKMGKDLIEGAGTGEICVITSGTSPIYDCDANNQCLQVPSEGGSPNIRDPVCSDSSPHGCKCVATPVSGTGVEGNPCLPNNPCGTNASCTYSGSDYTCTCNAGFHGDITTNRPTTCVAGDSDGGGSDSCDISSISPPDNGTAGTKCNGRGTINHGESCDLGCNSRYTLSGEQASCNNGVLGASTITCVLNSPTPTCSNTGGDDNNVPFHCPQGRPYNSSADDIPLGGTYNPNDETQKNKCCHETNTCTMAYGGSTETGVNHPCNVYGLVTKDNYDPPITNYPQWYEPIKDPGNTDNPDTSSTSALSANNFNTCCQESSWTNYCALENWGNSDWYSWGASLGCSFFADS